MPSELTYQDITLGSYELDQLVDSSGAPLIETASTGAPDATSDFKFELGVFNEGFTPLIDNLSDWKDNWQTFDVAKMAANPEPLIGVQGGMTDEGKTVSDDPLAETNYDFSGQNAYLWIYNSTDVTQGSEWFVGRVDSWVFPEIDLLGGDCASCPGPLPVQWSTSQFSTVTGSEDVPLFGSQSGVEGAGSYTQVDEDFTLQTFAIVPEPATIFLPAVIGLLVAFRHFRHLRRKGRA